MEVTLLGTGAIYTKYNCASVIIDKKILFDMGPGVFKNLYRLQYNIKDIKMIILTHLHYDHYLDLLLFFNNIMNYKNLEPIYVVGPIGTREKLSKLCYLASGNYFDCFLQDKIIFIEIDENLKQINKISDYKIDVVRVEHENIPAYGYIMNEKLGITGDTTICAGVEKIVKVCDTVIVDTSVIETTKDHLGVDALQNMLNKYPNLNIYATHLRDTTRTYLLEHTISRLRVPEDGDTFDIIS